MAAPEALAAVGLKHMEAAFAAVRAEKNAGAAEDTARQAKHRATYMTMACVAVADAVRQLTYKRAKKRMEQGNTQDGDEVIMRNYKSVAAYNAYVHNTLQVDIDSGISDTGFKRFVKTFWSLAHKFAPLEFNNVTIDRVALDRDQWTESVQNSPYAEERTLLFVLADGFGDALLARLPTNSWDKSLNLLIQEVDATVKTVDAPAKRLQMALDPTAMRYWKRALDASKAAAGAEKAEREFEDAMLRARSDKNVHNYKALIAIGQLDAWRQKRYLESGRTLDDYKSARAFFMYLETLKTDEMPTNFLNNVVFFWSLLFAYGPLELKDGATIARGALDKASWTTKVGKSKFADPSTLDFVLNGGLADGFLTELRKQGHGIETLNKKAKEMLEATTDAPPPPPPDVAPATPANNAAPVTPAPSPAAPATPAAAPAPAPADEEELPDAPPPEVSDDDAATPPPPPAVASEDEDEDAPRRSPRRSRSPRARQSPAAPAPRRSRLPRARQPATQPAASPLKRAHEDDDDASVGQLEPEKKRRLRATSKPLPPPSEDDWKCPICLEVPPGRIHIKCSRGCIFCAECLEQAAAMGDKCATCREPFGRTRAGAHPIRNFPAERAIQDYRARFPGWGS